MMLDFADLVHKYGIKSKGVLHCGASTGQESELYDMFGVKKMIYIEAIPSVFNDLVKHIAKYPQAIGINECISDVDGQEVVFNISNNEAQSSSFLEFGYHQEIHPTVKYIDKINLKTKRVDTIIEEYGIDLDGVTLLNLDLQGVELLCLKSMGELLHKFEYAIIEVNKRETYIGCAGIGDIDKYIGKFGFKRVETGDWVAETWTDAFYKKIEK